MFDANMYGRVDNIYADSGIFEHWRRGCTPTKAVREIIANSLSVGLDWNASELCLGLQQRRWWSSEDHFTAKQSLVAADNGQGCPYEESARLHTIGREPERPRKHGLNNVGFQQAATMLGDGCVSCWRVKKSGETQDWIGIYGDVTRRDERGLPVFAKYKFPSSDRSSMTAWKREFCETNRNMPADR